ncbi:MAG: crossover junction endodeoxyribonuclease RuvC [Chlorobiaceae bacterium]|nr:crossover junction endodeoxyribonuclease RuvC [Chlorobiaceae bacterium]
MIVLGVDPGSRTTGYGVISGGDAGYSVLGCGVVRMKGSIALAERIGMIWTGLEEVIAATRPDCIAIETAFVGRNVRSAMILGQVRGAVIALAVRNGLPIREYAPREVKLAVTGYGSAGKEQVASMLSKLLPLGGKPMPSDATDALGIALCDLSRNGPAGPGGRVPLPSPGKKRKKQGWSDFVDGHPELIA